MTNIRAKGFSDKIELAEELAELEEFNDVHELADGMSELPESGTSLREVAWLRKEVADMRERLLIRQRRMENSNPAQESWSTVQTTAALGATLVLGVLLLRARFNQGRVQQDRFL
jgi:hypothetical protein